ncbi:hypothetical protein AYY27_13300 [Photobacterium damselae]|nr:hypothetical protein AYY27_13300 [Photobacterium damselae]
MENFNDKDIIEWINNKQYSNLVFLNDQWLDSDNKWYLGFYYFFQLQRGRNTKAIIKEVVLRYGDNSSAYLYLAQTAKKIYNSFYNNHIPIGFCREAVKMNPSNSEAHWILYTISRDVNSFIKAIELEYRIENYEQISAWLNEHYRHHYNDFSRLTHETWFFLRSILQNSKIETNNEILIWAFFNLDEVESCLRLVDDSKHVDFEIIKTYYDNNLINKKLAIEKLYYWEIDKLLEGDDKNIYIEYVKEAKKNKSNPTHAVLIQKAFKAKVYEDIEHYYKEVKKSDSFFIHRSSGLYFLLAQLELGQTLDENEVDFFHRNFDSLDDESKLLYQVLKFKLNLQKVKETTIEGFFLENFAPYQAAQKIINQPKIIEHYLYDSLKEELYQLKVNWYSEYNKRQLDGLKTKLLNVDMTDDDFQYLHHFGIECHEYNFVIKSVVEYHQHTAPSISSYNCIGVCYERKGDIEMAFKYYNLALKLMQSQQEFNYIIISNYIYAAKRLPQIKLPDDELHKLCNLFNIELTNQFTWDIFLTRPTRHNCLFKYTSFSMNTIDSLLNKYFYLAEKEQLNDPIELPDIETVDDDTLIASNYRLCSLTNNNNSMLMWSHYAQEHQGIMIEYWFGGEFPSGVGIGKVSYSDGLKRSKEKAFYTFNQYLLTKNSDWEYEDEVRIFSNQTDKVNFELFDYPNININNINACVSSITLGYKFPFDKRELIFNIVSMINSNRKEYEPLVKLREAYIDDENKFSLKYRDLLD